MAYPPCYSQLVRSAAHDLSALLLAIACSVCYAHFVLGDRYGVPELIEDTAELAGRLLRLAHASYALIGLLTPRLPADEYAHHTLCVLPALAPFTTGSLLTTTPVIRICCVVCCALLPDVPL